VITDLRAKLRSRLGLPMDDSRDAPIITAVETLLRENAKLRDALNLRFGSHRKPWTQVRINDHVVAKDQNVWTVANLEVDGEKIRLSCVRWVEHDDGTDMITKNFKVRAEDTVFVFEHLQPAIAAMLLDEALGAKS